MSETPKDKPARRGFGRVVFRFFRILVVAVAGFVGLVWCFQRHLLYFPRSEFVARPSDVGLAYEEVNLQAEDGTRIHAWYVPAGDESNLLLFCHGNAGNISGRMPSLQLFHQLGLSVLMFDYRGYGKSEGTPSEEGTYQDARAAWDYLVKSRKVAPERIVVFGRSLGGAVAARLAKEKKPGALMLESTFTSVPDLAAELYPFLPVRLLCRFSYDTRSIIADISCPILIVHSKTDDIIPYSHGKALFEAAGEPKSFLEIAGGHNDGPFVSRQAYTQGLEEFLGVMRRR